MTAKRLPKKQPKRDLLIANTLISKPLAECTLEECLRLNAFFDTILKYLAANPRDPPCQRGQAIGTQDTKTVPPRLVWRGFAGRLKAPDCQSTAIFGLG